MKAERIVYTPEVIMPQRKKSDDMVAVTVPKSTAKTAAMLAASMLALASMAKVDVHKTSLGMNPKDLTYESTNEVERTVFSDFVRMRPEIKNYARLDKNTLRFVDELDTVIDKSLTDGVNDIQVLGYTVDGNLYPQKGKPLSEQKYLDEEGYDKAIKEFELAQKAEKAEALTLAGLVFLYLLYTVNKHENDVKSGKKKVNLIVPDKK